MHWTTSTVRKEVGEGLGRASISDMSAEPTCAAAPGSNNLENHKSVSFHIEDLCV